MQAVVIAAGESSRFWPLNQDHKSLFYLLGKPILYWTLKGLAENGIKDILILQKKGSSIQKILQEENDFGINLSFADIDIPRGTGDALWRAKDFVKGPFFVVWPDKILSEETIALMLQQKADGVLAGAKTDSPWDYGIISFDEGRIDEIVENPEPGLEPSDIKMSGLCLLTPEYFEIYEKLPQHREPDFVDALNKYIATKKVSFVLIENDFSLKYPWHVLSFSKALLHSGSFHHYVASSARIGLDVHIEGEIFVGDNSVIKDRTIIEGPCYIGANCQIGYNNVLRGPLVLEDGVKTGSFLEIKNSVVQKGTHFHSGYVGDSIIGRDCRFGAGVITANKRLDRKNVETVIKGNKVDTKRGAFGVVVGDMVKVGIHAGTMPGVMIGSNSNVGPGTIVFKNLENKSVLFSQESQVLK